MKVYTDFTGGTYQGDPIHYFEFDRFANDDDSVTLCYGSVLKRAREGSRLVFIDLEEPIPRPENIRNKWGVAADRILNLCPWSSAWHNGYFKTNKCRPVFFPFNPRYIPDTTQKDISVLYAGQDHKLPIIHDIMCHIHKFKYAHISFTPNAFTTHTNVSYKEKMSIYGRSKIAIVHNQVWCHEPWATKLKTMIPDWANNYCYSRIEQDFAYPQLKSRLFEAAFSRCIILCLRDKFNIVEHFFTPDKEFIYFDSPGDLATLIPHILSHYDKYQNMVDNAYIRANNEYTTRRFYEKFILPEHC